MSKMIGSYVVVRTYSAGVHVGVLTSKKGKLGSLKDSRRIWSWTEANTCSEIANHGVGSASKVAEAVLEIDLTEVIEVIRCTAKAEANLRAAKW